MSKGGGGGRTRCRADMGQTPPHTRHMCSKTRNTGSYQQNDGVRAILRPRPATTFLSSPSLVTLPPLPPITHILTPFTAKDTLSVEDVRVARIQPSTTDRECGMPRASCCRSTTGSRRLAVWRRTGWLQLSLRRARVRLTPVQVQGTWWAWRLDQALWFPRKSRCSPPAAKGVVGHAHSSSTVAKYTATASPAPPPHPPIQANNHNHTHTCRIQRPRPPTTPTPPPLHRYYEGLPTLSRLPSWLRIPLHS